MRVSKATIAAVVAIAALNIAVFGVARKHFPRIRYSVFSDKDLVCDVQGYPCQGGTDSALTVVVFGDLECPYSALLDPMLDSVAHHFGDAIRICYKIRPIYESKERRERDEMAYAAQNQGAFLPAKRMLFGLGSQGDWPADHAKLKQDLRLAEFRAAARLGLDTFRLEVDMKSAAVYRKIEAASKEADKFSIGRSPTVVVAGRLIEGLVPLDTILSKINMALARRQKVHAKEEQL